MWQHPNYQRITAMNELLSDTTNHYREIMRIVEQHAEGTMILSAAWNDDEEQYCIITENEIIIADYSGNIITK